MEQKEKAKANKGKQRKEAKKGERQRNGDQAKTQADQAEGKGARRKDVSQQQMVRDQCPPHRRYRGTLETDYLRKQKQDDTTRQKRKARRKRSREIANPERYQRLQACSRLVHQASWRCSPQRVPIISCTSINQDLNGVAS